MLYYSLIYCFHLFVFIDISLTHAYKGLRLTVFTYFHDVYLGLENKMISNAILLEYNTSLFFLLFNFQVNTCTILCYY